VRIWNSATGAEVGAWQGHVSAPSCIAWAPQRLLVASGGHDLLMWIPDVAQLQRLPQQQQQQQQQQPLPQLGAQMVF
jgi:WD40 repeat protein